LLSFPSVVNIPLVTDSGIPAVDWRPLMFLMSIVLRSVLLLLFFLSAVVSSQVFLMSRVSAVAVVSTAVDVSSVTDSSNASQRPCFARLPDVVDSLLMLLSTFLLLQGCW
jgi:hypothetical protein